MLCHYSDIFGKPGEGFHKERILGFAAYDLIGTLLLIIIISMISGISLIVVSMITLILTIFIHKIFCVETALNKKLGL